MFTMNFSFKRGEEDSIAQINAALASMCLSSVSIENCESYMITKTTFDKNNQMKSVELGYGFDSISLECKQEDDEELHSWQLEAEVLPKGEISGTEVFHDRWCIAHPDCVMRVLQCISYDTADAFLVLYHDKKNDENY